MCGRDRLVLSGTTVFPTTLHSLSDRVTGTVAEREEETVLTKLTTLEWEEAIWADLGGSWDSERPSGHSRLGIKQAEGLRWE